MNNNSILSLPNRKEIILLLAAFAIRFMRVLYAPDIADADGYDTWAHAFFETAGWINPSWTIKQPGYSLFIFLFHIPFPHAPLLILFAQSVLGALTCLIAMRLATKTFNPSIGLLTGYLCAISFGLLHISGIYAPDELFSFLTLCSFLIISYRNQTFKDGILIGVAWGFAGLTRTEALAFPFLVMTAAIFKRFPWPATKGFFLGFLLLTMPWAIRNIMLLKTFAPIGLQSGFALWGSNNPHAKGRWMNAESVQNAMPEEWKVYESLSLVERDQYAKRKSFEYLLSLSPQEFIRLIIARYAYYLQPAIRMDDHRIFDATFLFILPLSLYGLIKLRGYPEAFLWIGWLLVLFFRVLLIACVGARYRSALVPLLTIASAPIIYKMWQTMKTRPLILSWASANLFLLFFPQIPTKLWHVFKGYF